MSKAVRKKGSTRSRSKANRKSTGRAETLDMNTCVYLQGEECPNRAVVKDPNKMCAREAQIRERILERAHKPLEASAKVSKKELEMRYCLYSEQKSLDVNKEEIQEKLRK